MLDFRALLQSVGQDPSSVLLIRHTARDRRLQHRLPWLAEERPELFLAYQRIQWRSGERAMLRASHVAAFIGMSPGEATFVGLSRITDHRQISPAEYLTFPGNAELMAYGMVTDRADQPSIAFDLEPELRTEPWKGRVTTAWSPGQTWARWASRSSFPIVEISRESRLVEDVPDWRKVSLSWADLQTLPMRWQAAFCQWRGIYFIFDEAQRQGYVGSASGTDNLLGRWRAYAATGHGGNARMRASKPETLRFSILERTSPDLAPSGMLQLEESWKRRLLTREFGLNAN